MESFDCNVGVDFGIFCKVIVYCVSWKMVFMYIVFRYIYFVNLISSEFVLFI